MPRPRPDQTKHCPRCKEIKPVEEFYKSEKYDGGYSSYCKVCHRIQNNKRWVENPEGMREKAKEAYSKHKDARHANSVSYQKRMRKENPAKFRAKKFFDGRYGSNAPEIAPDVTKKYLEELFRTTTHCHCCGKELCLEYEERETRKYRSNPNAPSIDRVNNHKSYTRSNIAIICWECNYRKTDLSLEDLEMMITYIKKYGDFENVR